MCVFVYFEQVWRVLREMFRYVDLCERKGWMGRDEADVWIV